MQLNDLPASHINETSLRHTLMILDDLPGLIDALGNLLAFRLCFAGLRRQGCSALDRLSLRAVGVSQDEAACACARRVAGCHAGAARLDRGCAL